MPVVNWGQSPPAARHSLVLLGLGGKGPRSAAEWPAPWKRSFCASGQDRNRTLVLALVSRPALSAFGCFSVVPALALLLCRFVCAAKHWRPVATHSGGLAGSRNQRQHG